MKSKSINNYTVEFSVVRLSLEIMDLEYNTITILVQFNPLLYP